MKKFLLSAFVLFSITLLSAQPPDRFIKYYYSESGTNIRVGDIINTDYGYMSTGIIYGITDMGVYYRKRCFLGMDFNGEVLWEKSYGNEYNQYVAYGLQMNCFVKDDAGGYYYLSPAITYDKQGQHIIHSQLLKLTATGDTLWTKNYYGSSAERPMSDFLHLTILPDGGFALTGNEGIEDENWPGYYEECYLLLLRLDDRGNELWRQKYDNRGFLTASTYDPLLKRHVLVGQKVSNNHTHAIVYITDSLGNLLHNKTMITRAVLVNIDRQSDGSFIACGKKNTMLINEETEYSKPLIVRFDREANIIWQKEYGDDQLFNEFDYVRVLQGDTIIAAGFIDTIYSSTSRHEVMLSLYKLTPEGDVIWSRMIYIDEDYAELGNMCKGLISTIDGGYAMATNSKTMVLVKVDEYGCIEEGCQENDVGITGPNDVAKFFRVYPNPAKEYAVFEFRGDFGGQAQVELQNIAGQVVDRFELRSSQYQYPASKLEQGVYLATLKVNGKRVATEKVIILK